MSPVEWNNSRIDPVNSLYKFHTTVDVLRLDLIHSVISGNKWFKLKEYLIDAGSQNKNRLITFGGAYSNHIVATAAAAQAYGFGSIGIIRGEKPEIISHSLTMAKQYGMQLYFVSREDFKKRLIPPELTVDRRNEFDYIINEGGYGKKGVEGALHIMDHLDQSQYTHIIVAVGTGTTMAGLIKASSENTEVMGISVFKNHFSLEDEILELLPEEYGNKIKLIHEYHFGGYAKYSRELIGFMNDWFLKTNIPSDFVYTGKMFFAVNDLIIRGYFPSGSKILMIHSGGLQGNKSLPEGTLIF